MSELHWKPLVDESELTQAATDHLAASKRSLDGIDTWNLFESFEFPLVAVGLFRPHEPEQPHHLYWCPVVWKEFVGVISMPTDEKFELKWMLGRKSTKAIYDASPDLHAEKIISLRRYQMDEEFKNTIDKWMNGVGIEF